MPGRANEKSDARITIRLSTSELRQLKAQAEQEGRTLSEVARSLLQVGQHAKVRPLPCNLEAEAEVLGALLEFPEAGIPFLDPEDLWDENNRLIFRGMRELYETGVGISVVTVHNWLQQHAPKKMLASYLDGLAAAARSAALIVPHAKIVKALAERRRIIQACEELAAHGYEDRESVDDYRALVMGRLFEACQTGRVGQVIRSADLAQVLEADTGAEGLKVGLTVIDDLLHGLQPGHLIVTAGRPGIGKTTFGLQMANHTAFKEGLPTFFMSAEMSRVEIGWRLLAQLTGRSVYDLRTERAEPWDLERLRQAPFHLSDASAPSILEVASHLRGLVAAHGVKIAFVDYLQKLTAPRAETRALEVGTVIRGLKNLAKDLSIPVVVLCQLNREVEHRNVKRPQLADLRESGEIEQEADAVIFLWTPEERLTKVELPVNASLAKNRHGETGEVEMAFHRTKLWFEDRS
ncbi:MAG: AAA family ATPase [candidate division NC10 bacterium]|nr:AAA family ATPase [candidate division NC10 bacterium]